MTVPLTIVYKRPCESCRKLAPSVPREIGGERFWLCADCAADHDEQCS